MSENPTLRSVAHDWLAENNLKVSTRAFDDLLERLTEYLNTKHEPPVNAFKGSGPDMAQQLRTMANEAELGETTFFIAGRLQTDKSLVYNVGGYSSRIERMGLLAAMQFYLAEGSEE